MHDNPIGRNIFKLEIFNLLIFSRTLDIKCSFGCSNFALFRILRKACFYCVFYFSRFIQFLLLYNGKTKELLIVYRSKQKSSTCDQVLLSSREHPRVFLCCSAPTFMLFHSLFLKFVNNLEISCQEDRKLNKVEFTL